MRLFAPSTVFAIVLVTLFLACSPQPKNSSGQSTTNDSSSSAATAILDTVSNQQNAQWNDQRVRGVDFLAMGNEPFWSLEIDFDKIMRFKSMTQVDSINTPIPKADQAQDAPVTRYRAQTEGGELIVTISQQECTDNMSGEEFAYSVNIRVKTGKMTDFEDFSGCGLYLGDYRLNDIWALGSLNGEEVDTEQFPKNRPYIEIHLADQKLLGYAGCNRINGNISFGKETIQIGPLISTRRSCSALEFEQQFTKALSDRPLKYTYENRQLILENSHQQLVFRKVD